MVEKRSVHQRHAQGLTHYTCTHLLAPSHRVESRLERLIAALACCCCCCRRFRRCKSRQKSQPRPITCANTEHAQQSLTHYNWGTRRSEVDCNNIRHPTRMRPIHPRGRREGGRHFCRTHQNIRPNASIVNSMHTYKTNHAAVSTTTSRAKGGETAWITKGGDALW